MRNQKEKKFDYISLSSGGLILSSAGCFQEKNESTSNMLYIIDERFL